MGSNNPELSQMLQRVQELKTELVHEKRSQEKARLDLEQKRKALRLATTAVSEIHTKWHVRAQTPSSSEDQGNGPRLWGRNQLRVWSTDKPLAV